MDSAKLRHMEDFAFIAYGYVKEYASRKYPESQERCFSGLGYGHADSIHRAISHRRRFVQAIQATASGLSVDELEVAKAEALAKFEYSKKFRKPGQDGSIKYDVIEDHFDRLEVAELFNETVAIALNDFSKVKSADRRFGKPLRSPQAAFGGKMARYKAWLGR